jgi:DNA-binding NarL/FixJ family response regulator
LKNNKNDAEQNKARVLVVDDHPIVRQGLVQLINNEPDLAVCAQADTAHDGMKLIASEKPDVAIVDLSLADKSGLEMIKDIKTRFPKLPVLVLSMHDEQLYAERALRAGALGYVMKEEATENVMTAIRSVIRGEIYVSGSMTGKILHHFVGGRPAETKINPVERLSDRELEVFQLIGQGRPTREIAEKLFLSVKTIETYRAHIKEKLKLQNATQLLQQAIQWVQSQNQT